MSSNTITVHCSLFTNTVPTQNYECRISDADKQAGKNDRDICKDTDKDSNTDLYRETDKKTQTKRLSNRLKRD